LNIPAQKIKKRMRYRRFCRQKSESNQNTQTWKKSKKPV